MALDPPAAGSAAQDSLPVDTVPAGLALTKGILMERPAPVEARPLGEGSPGGSWLLTCLLLLTVVVALRYRRNSRFLALMLHDVTEVRERHNAFDDTVRETSFVWLLNVLWCVAAGILVYGWLYGGADGVPFYGDGIRRLGVCIGMAGAYTVFLTSAYAAVGNLFAASAKASLWVKGYLSSQGLESIFMLPVALLGLCVPGFLGAMVTAGAIIFILAKILFIYKGFCIFFTELASWVLFLYYLCSLEIVPIVLTYVSTKHLCGLIG